MTEIKKAAVIGAGVMGAGIAAQIANAGVPVVLLDIVPKNVAKDAPKSERDAIAAGAVARMLKTKPAPFMHKRNAKLITPGNVEDDMALLGDCDWIVEAVLEDPKIKHDLYVKIEAARADGSIVSSNTSTIPLDTLTDGLPERFRRDFLITHFFNPPRYMRLLEIVTSADTRDDAADAVRTFGDVMLGKSVVDCHDRPGFIANRIGTFWLQCAVVEAMDGGLSVEEADAVVGKPMGIPKTGVFGLLDLVGLDLMPHVLSSLKSALPETDAFQAIYRKPEMIERMITEGYTGRKGKGGFYRLNKSGGGRVKEAMDLVTGEYHTAKKVKLSSVSAGRRKGLRALVKHNDKGGKYAWRVLSKTLAYAASLVPEIADDIVAVDEAMRLGYNWKFGPFELLDKMGPGWFANKLRANAIAVPPLMEIVGERSFYRIHEGRRQYLRLDGTYADVPRPDGVIMLEDIKRTSEPILTNRSASLWDLGDGVVCLEFHSKMNSLNLFTLSMVEKAVEIVKREHKALVIYNEGSHFSVGANLGLLMVPAFLRWAFPINWMVRKGQRAYAALKFAPFPVVSAPSGMALGGGCEILLHSDAVQPHAETYTGLVEVGVGIIPGWGGCKEMLLRWANNPKRAKGPMPTVIKAFETISTAKVATSAEEARSLLFCNADDRVTMNRYRLLADAKTRALELAKNYFPPKPQEISLPGKSAEVAMNMAVKDFRKKGLATPHDEVVAGGLATVLSGGDTDALETVSEDDLLALERQAFGKLAVTSGTIARVKHMLTTGKPLRN